MSEIFDRLCWRIARRFPGRWIFGRMHCGHMDGWYYP